MRSIINRTSARLNRAMLTALLIGIAAPALAQEQASIAIHDNGIAPAEIQVPAATKVALTITNQQQRAAEFESKRCIAKR